MIKQKQIIKIKNAPKNKPYLFENVFKITDEKRFNKEERKGLLARLKNQLDDSSKVNKIDNLFFLGTIKNPVAYDTLYSRMSANNLRTSMYHLGYYNAMDSFWQDTTHRRVTVHYELTAGNPTLIDTIAYRLKNNDMVRMVQSSTNESYLQKYKIVTKTAVTSEIARLVDSFRNNGYYKFTAAELKVLGDSSVAALTNISSDPFEQLQLISDAQKKRDSPTVKLAVVINYPDDTTKLLKYSINKIFVLSDYRPADNLLDTVKTAISPNKYFTERYHTPLFNINVLLRSITLHSGDIYKQQEYINTLYNLTKLAVWQSINIKLLDNLDEPNKVDIVIELIPAKKYSFYGSLESSFASTSNTVTAVGSSLFGLSANFGITNKNVFKQAIRMAHNFRFGIELNNKNTNGYTGLINSTEAGYTNTTTIPKRLILSSMFNKYGFTKGESFVNTGASYTNRLNSFSLQSINLNLGVTAFKGKTQTLIIRPLNAEYSYLFNQSDTFNSILNANPFLRYSYNTSFILGMSVSYSWIKQKIVKTIGNVNLSSVKINTEESGLTIGQLPILKNEKRNYVKLDIEYKYTVTRKNNTELAFRIFGGVGKPLKGDSALPFFKQFFGGGSNSMRGWPVRGIGRGSQPLAAFSTNTFNDRTGDIQFESNVEFRHNIAKIIPEILTLKGGLFIDIGNVWNITETTVGGAADGSQFKFNTFYKDLGLSAGYGLRVVFSGIILRGDFSFRFKRPETSNINNGWKSPDISFGDGFRKIFGKEYKEWRYENFNFTLGINYAF